MRNTSMHIALVFGALAIITPFALPLAVAADEQVQTDPAAPPPATPDKPKMICKRESSTGSAIPTKRCRTQQQSEAERQAAKDNMNRMKDTAGPTSGNGS